MLENAEEYQKVVDVEWQLDTSDREIFFAGCMVEEDLLNFHK